MGSDPQGFGIHASLSVRECGRDGRLPFGGMARWMDWGKMPISHFMFYFSGEIAIM
jgi:hypothetical protein